MALTLIRDVTLGIDAVAYFSTNSSVIFTSGGGSYNFTVKPVLLEPTKIAFVINDNPNSRKNLIFLNPITDAITTIPWLAYNYGGLDLSNSNFQPSFFHIIKHPNGLNNSFFIVGIGYRNVSGPNITDCTCLSQEFNYSGVAIGPVIADFIGPFTGPDNYGFVATDVNAIIESTKVKFIIGLNWTNSSTQANTAAVKVDPGLLVDWIRTIGSGYNLVSRVLLERSDSLVCTFTADWPIGPPTPQARGFARDYLNVPALPANTNFFAPPGLIVTAFAKANGNFNVMFFTGDPFSTDGTPIFIREIEVNNPSTPMAVLQTFEWLPPEIGVYYQGAFNLTNDKIIGVFDNNATKFIQEIDNGSLSVIGSVLFANQSAFYQVQGLSLDASTFAAFSDSFDGFLQMSIYGTEPISVPTVKYISSINFIVTQDCQPCAPILTSTRRDLGLGS
jgi:hypothetical protein